MSETTDKMDKIWNAYPQEYKDYRIAEAKEIREMRDSMIKSGFEFVCIEPDTMIYKEWKRCNE